MKLIDKNKLVAEIERLRHQVDLSTRHGEGLADAYHAVNKLISSLEVKEVDLKEELEKYLGACYSSKDCRVAAHFFKFGVNTSNPLTWEDMKLIRLVFDAIEASIHLGSIKIQPMTKEYYQEVLKRFKERKEK